MMRGKKGTKTIREKLLSMVDRDYTPKIEKSSYAREKAFWTIIQEDSPEKKKRIKWASWKVSTYQWKKYSQLSTWRHIVLQLNIIPKLSKIEKFKYFWAEQVMHLWKVNSLKWLQTPFRHSMLGDEGAVSTAEGMCDPVSQVFIHLWRQ